MNLNLGCLKTKLEDHVNLDINPESKPDINIDLDKEVLPFEDNTVESVRTHHTLEHLKNPLFCIKELYRVCKNGSKIYITVPHGFAPGYFQDLTHHSGFGYYTFHYLNVDDNGEYTNDLHSEYGDMKFKVKARFISAVWFRRVGLDWLFNKFPKIYENYLIGIFPARELYYELEVVK